MSKLLDPWLSAAAVRYSVDHGDLLGSLLGGRNAQLIEICGSAKHRRDFDTNLSGRAAYDPVTWCRFSDKQTTVYAWISDKTIIDFNTQDNEDGVFAEQLYSVLEIVEYRWTYEIPYLKDPVTNDVLLNTPPQVCLHIQRIAYREGGNRIFMPLSGELCSLEESGRSLEKEDRIELNDWIASLHKKHRQEEVSSRLGVKPSIPTEAEMEAEVKEKATTWHEPAAWKNSFDVAGSISAVIPAVKSVVKPAAASAVKRETVVVDSSPPPVARQKSSPKPTSQTIPPRQVTPAPPLSTTRDSSPAVEPTPSLRASVGPSFEAMQPPAAQVQPRMSYEPYIGSTGETKDDISIIVQSQCTGQPESRQPPRQLSAEVEEMDYEQEVMSSSLVKETLSNERNEMELDEVVKPRARSRSAFSTGYYYSDSDDEISKRLKVTAQSSPARPSEAVTQARLPSPFVEPELPRQKSVEPIRSPSRQPTPRQPTPRQSTPRQTTPRQPTPVASPVKVQRVEPTLPSPLLEISGNAPTAELREISISVLSSDGPRNNANILRLLQQVDFRRDSVVQAGRTAHSKLKSSPRPSYALLESFYTAVEVKLLPQAAFSDLSLYWRRILVESRHTDEATTTQLLDKIAQRKDLASLDDPVGHPEFSNDELALFHHFWRKDKLLDRSTKSQISTEWKTSVVGESAVESKILPRTREWVEGVLSCVDDAERVTFELEQWKPEMIATPSIVKPTVEAAESVPAPRQTGISAPTPVINSALLTSAAGNEDEARPNPISIATLPASALLPVPSIAISRRSTRSQSPANLPLLPATTSRPTNPVVSQIDDDFPASQMVERIPVAPARADRSTSARVQRRVAEAAQKNSERLKRMSSVVEESSNLASSSRNSSS